MHEKNHKESCWKSKRFFLLLLENEVQKFKTVFLFYNKGHTLKFSNFDALNKNDKKNPKNIQDFKEPYN